MRTELGTKSEEHPTTESSSTSGISSIARTSAISSAPGIVGISSISSLSRVAAFAVLLLAGCGSRATDPPPPPPCDAKCQDSTALRALRETAKLAFNMSLQGKPVGAHDVTTPCPMGGTVRIFGTATSNALQGSTEVKLTYEFTACGYVFQDDDPEDNYRMVFTGSLSQEGTLAVQPTATTALVMKSDSMIFAGTVYDPPIDYAATCPLMLGQNGNNLTGTLCDRVAGVDL